MAESEKLVRETARKLLEEKKVDLVIGYERGTLPLRVTPCFITEAEDADRLVFDVTCDSNLAKYLVGREGKVGIAAKGCDARSIVACIAENQVNRDNIFIIGVPCSGVIDRKKVDAALDGEDVLEAKLDGDNIVLKGSDFERSFPVKGFLDDSCNSCKRRNPPLYDVLAGDKVPEVTDSEELPGTSAFELKPSAERWEYFTKELNKCIRCYACRNVCPLCYCQECFVDQNMPTWLGKADNISDTMVYHIVRVFHLIGRCVDCGACSRACPMGIDLRKLTQKMIKLVKEFYGFEAGLNPEAVPPLATFKQDDPQEFIK